MNYNMETIEHLAQQLAEMIKMGVDAQQSAGEEPPLIREIENGMREALLQIGQRALGLFLSSMQTDTGKRDGLSVWGKAALPTDARGAGD